MDIIVPEAQGDAGIGFLQSIARKDFAKNLRIICLGLDSWELPSYLFRNSFQSVIGISLPPVTATNEREIVATLQTKLINLNLSEGYLAPTSECLTGVLTNVVIRSLFQTKGISMRWFPTREAWSISRDKLQLFHKVPYVPETLGSYVYPSFGKPRCGSGSKGCQLVTSSEQAGRLDDYVFQRFIEGDYFVVDLIGHHAITRKVKTQKGGSDTEFFFCRDFDLEGLALEVRDALPGSPPVLNVQFIFDGEKYHVIDIGTRLSGAIGCLLEYDINLWDLLQGDAVDLELAESPIKRYWSAFPCP